MNFIRKFQVEIKTGPRCLVLHHQRRKIHVNFEKPKAVRLTQHCTIFLRCKCVVNATTSGIASVNNMLFKAIDDKTQECKRIRLGDGIVDVKNKTVQLTIYNPTTKLVT
ncbi:unnamed protein product, partial [Didymodactylos carnosus]